MLGVLSLVPMLLGLAGKIFGNKGDRDFFAYKIKELEIRSELEPLLRQIEVNVEEGRSSNVFVAGWRPMVGWVCAIGFGWHFLLLPIIAYLVGVFGGTVPNIVFDISTMNAVLAGMLGLPVAALRSYEKVNGITTGDTTGDRVVTRTISADEFLRVYTKRFSKVTPKHREIISQIFDKIRDQQEQVASKGRR